jgi:hypothetical protein
LLWQVGPFFKRDSSRFRHEEHLLDRVNPSGLTAKWAGYGGKESFSAAAFGAGTLLTSGASAPET